jgi:hypothetical protein
MVVVHPELEVIQGNQVARYRKEVEYEVDRLPGTWMDGVEMKPLTASGHVQRKRVSGLMHGPVQSPTDLLKLRFPHLRLQGYEGSAKPEAM